MPEISIITPVLNQVSTIEACIRSVAEQNVDVEHIIIDGGSTDGTVELLERNSDKLTYWISEVDSGQSDAINKGLRHAKGTFFNWLNADDQLTTNALKEVLKSIKTDTYVVVGKCEHVDESGTVLVTGSARIWQSLEETLGNYSMGQPSVFYRTDLIKGLGGLNTDLHLCLDMDLWFRYLLKFGQKNIQQTDKTLSRFLVHQTSKSSTFGAEMKAEKYGLYHALLAGFPMPDRLKAYFSSYPIPKSVNYNTNKALDTAILFANFSWHLMVESYQQNDFEAARDYFEIVKAGKRLSKLELLKWDARFASVKIRGK